MFVDGVAGFALHPPHEPRLLPNLGMEMTLPLQQILCTPAGGLIVGAIDVLDSDDVRILIEHIATIDAHGFPGRTVVRI
jgi:hypothetical protein